MSEQTSSISKKKQSIIAGGLISSGGIFIAKLIGLFYAVPFNSLLGSQANLAYYGVAYQIYNYLLSLCIAGFPFAIATLVAKYSSRGDFQTTILIRKLSTQIMVIFGLVAMLFVIIFSTPLATLVLPANADNTETMRTVLILISFALFFVPVLSSARGFYQGLKHMELYALSQVLEQIARVIFLLSASAIAVYIFQKDKVWSVYFGVISASISAILAIVHIKFYDRKQMKEIKRLARAQEMASVKDRKMLLRELVFIAFPYLIGAALGYSDAIINTVFLNKGLQAFGESAAQIELISGTINYGVLKLMAIPMILAPGFSVAIIPHITNAIEKRNIKLVHKNIRDCIDIVVYIALPLSFCLFVFAKPIYAIMFPPANPADLDMCAYILSWFSIEAFLSTVDPILSSLLMAVGLRRLNVRNQIIMVTIKFSITFFLLKYFGFLGLVASSLISMGVYTALCVYTLTKNYNMKWKYTINKLFVNVLGLIGLFAMASICSSLGLKGYGVGRGLGIIQLGISGLLSVGVYIAITAFFQVPQSLFNLDLATIKKKFKRKK